MASDFDLSICGGTVISPSSTSAATIQDIGILDGQVAAIEPNLGGSSRETIDASGLHILQGLIDSHVHFNDPGRADWEGFGTGSRAFAAGGGTLFFDMPLNAHPPTLDAASFDQKLAVAQNASFVDFAFWGGLVPGNLDHLQELSERGVIGFKAFMSNSGIDDFPRADDDTLREGMKRAARLGKIVAIHAESETITSGLAQKSIAAGKTSIRDYLDSRPIHSELDAIQRALEMAGETGCQLHVVHVSCGAGIALIACAQKLGVNVTCETCPHYLTFTEEDMLEIGALAKCAPPLRPKSAQDALWQYLQTGQITTIGSDHSPAPPEMKKDPNFFNVWGGISGVQHTLALLITEGHIGRRISLSQLTGLLTCNVVKRFNIPSKGQIKKGMDADFALIDLNQAFTLNPADLLYRHRHSPYAGRKLTGKVVQTILRGRTVFKDGKIISKPLGRLVRPTK